jgi:hypothetical protein
MSRLDEIVEELYIILERNEISRRYMWNEDVLYYRLSGTDYEEYYDLLDEYDDLMNEKFKDKDALLKMYNECLIKLGYEEQENLNAVRKIFSKKIFISIRDFIAGRYEKAKHNIKEFREYMRRNKSLLYPLSLAKSENMRLFLKQIF